MSEYEAYWLMDFPLIIYWLNNYGDLKKSKQNKCKEKLVILQSIEIIVVKSKETRVITDTYSSGHLIHIIQ